MRLQLEAVCRRGSMDPDAVFQLIQDGLELLRLQATTILRAGWKIAEDVTVWANQPGRPPDEYCITLVLDDQEGYVPLAHWYQRQPGGPA